MRSATNPRGDFPRFVLSLPPARKSKHWIETKEETPEARIGMGKGQLGRFPSHQCQCQARVRSESNALSFLPFLGSSRLPQYPPRSIILLIIPIQRLMLNLLARRIQDPIELHPYILYQSRSNFDIPNIRRVILWSIIIMLQQARGVMHKRLRG